MFYVVRRQMVFFFVLSMSLLVLAGMGHFFGAAESAAQSLSTKLKIEVDETGLYGVSYDDIVAAGITDALDIDQMALSTNGQTVAFDVRGDGDNTFEPGEQIVFYGEGVPRPHYGFHRYDTILYWLAFDEARTQVTMQSNVSNGGAAVIDSVPTTMIVEEDLRYSTTNVEAETWAQFDNPDSQTTWFWTIWHNAATASQTFTVNVPHPVVTVDPVTVTAELFSASDSVDYNEYEVVLAVNDTPPVTYTWLNKNSLDVDTVFPADKLNAGENTITITSVNAASPFFLNHFEIAYERALIADENNLLFEYDIIGDNQFNLTGFTAQNADDLLVWDVSDPLAPVAVDLAAADVAIANGTATVQVGIAQDAAVALAVYAVDALRTPVTLSAYTPADITPPAGGAEWVMITSDDLLDEANRLADYRATSSDLTTFVVNADEVIAQYGNGYATSDAIVAYLTKAMETWNPAPRYLVLGGGATDNALQRVCDTCDSKWSTDEVEHVPMDYSFMDRFAGRLVSDYAYAMLIGDDLLPDLAVGRLPALDPTELATMIDKIIIYEAEVALGNLENASVLMLGEGDNIATDNFCANNETFASSVLPDSTDVEQFCIEPYRGEQGNLTDREYFATDNLDQSGLYTALFTDTLNTTNYSIVHYAGHGSWSNWGHDAISTEAIQQWQNSRPAVVISGDCLDANIAVPGHPSMAQAFMTQAGMAGAAAHWSATGLGYAIEHTLIQTHFYEALYEQDITTIGDAISYAKIKYIEAGYHPSELYSMNLMGDPAMKMVQAEEEVPTETPLSTETPIPTETPAPTAVPATCTVYLDKTTAWDGHIQGNITIENNDTAPIAGWTLSWEMASYEGYQSGWNASMSQAGNIFTASNNASHWNGTIPGNGGTKTFGFTFTSSESDFAQPAYFDLNGMMCVNGNGATEPPTIPTAVPTNTPAPTNTPVPTSTPLPTATTPPPPTGGGSCDVDYNLTTSWPGNFELNVQITNNDTAPIQNWELAWALGAGEAYSHGWDATFTPSGTNMTAAAPSWNSNIAAGGSASFGLQLTSNDDTLHIPADFFLNGASCNGTQPPVTPTPIPTLGTGDCSIAYDPVTAWPGHVELDVTITNHSTSMIDGWELLWSLRESENYYHGWNASLTQNGTAMQALSPNDWNNQIQPNGGTVSFGLQLTTPNDVVQLPSEFVLNGAVCSMDSLQETFNGEVSTDNPRTTIDQYPGILSATLTTESSLVGSGDNFTLQTVIQNVGERTSVPKHLTMLFSDVLTPIESELPSTTTNANYLGYEIPALQVNETITWEVVFQVEDIIPDDVTQASITLVKAHELDETVSIDLENPTTRRSSTKSSFVDTAEVNAPSRWSPVIIAPQVSEFSGAASYSYAFDTPVGIGGVQPALGLSYSSHTSNGSIHRDSGDVAEGWNLVGIPYIYRSNVEDCDTEDGYVRIAIDEFRMNLGGGSYKLEAVDKSQYGIYRAIGMPGYFIERRNSLVSNFDENEIGDSVTRDYWIVKATDGVEYRFGVDANSEQLLVGVYDDSCQRHLRPNERTDVVYGGHVENVAVSKYWLTDAVDIYGNKMVVEYLNSDRTIVNDPENGICTTVDNVSVCREVNEYPKTIRYNNVIGTDPTNSEEIYQTEVHIRWNTLFSSDSWQKNTLDVSTTRYHDVAGIHKLTGVAIYHLDIDQDKVTEQGVDAPQINANKPAWVYRLEKTAIDKVYGTTHLTLDRIRKCQRLELSEHVTFHNNKLLDCVSSATPAVEFDYERRTTSGGNVLGFNRSIYRCYLSAVQNGFGGTYKFDYSDSVFVDPDTTGRYHFVERVRAWDGYNHRILASEVEDVCIKADSEDAEPENARYDAVNATATWEYHYRPEDVCTSDGNVNFIVPGDNNDVNGVGEYCGDKYVEEDKISGLPNSIIGFSRVIVAGYGDNDTSNLLSLHRKDFNITPGPLTPGELSAAYIYDVEIDGIYDDISALLDVDNPDVIATDAMLPLPLVSSIYSYEFPGGVCPTVETDWENEQYMRCLAQTEQISRDANGGTNKIIENLYYSPESQGDASRQWGLPTRGETRVGVINSSGESEMELVRASETTYGIDTNSWLQRVVRKAVLDPDGVVAADTLSLYDENSDWANQTSLGNGELSRKFSRVDVDNVNGLWRYTEEAYTYSEAGSPVTTEQFYTYISPDGTTFAPRPSSDERNTTTIRFDDDGLRVRSVTNSVGHETTYDWHSDRPWLLLSQTAPNEAITEYWFDDTDRLSYIEIPDPETGIADYRSIEFKYQIGNVETHDSSPALDTVRIDEITAPLDPNNIITNTSYLNGFGMVEQTTTYPVDVDGSGGEARLIYSETAYDALGRVICKNAPSQGVFGKFGPAKCDETTDSIRTSYDALGRVLKVINVDGAETNHEYGIVPISHGLPFAATPGDMYHTVIDAENNQKRYDTDMLGRIRRMSDFTESGNENFYAQTIYGHDVLDQLVAITDTHGSVTTIEYDDLARKVSMTTPDMGHWQYAYDAQGNLKQQIDNKAQRICFYHDALGRTTHKGALNGEDCPAQAADLGENLLVENIHYPDDNGIMTGLLQRQEMTNGTAREWLYDYRGRITDETVTIPRTKTSDGTHTFTASYQYDDLNRLVTTTYPDGEEVTTTWNRQSQPESLNGMIDAVTTAYINDVHYNFRTQLTKMEIGNGLETFYGYHNDDEGFRLRDITTLGIADPVSGIQPIVQQYQYTQYDDMGNIKQIESSWQASAADNLPQQNDIERFEYDHLYRLHTAFAEASHPDTTQQMFEGYDHTGEMAYGYDEVGNLTDYKGRSYDYETWHSDCRNTDELPVMPHAVKQIEGDYFCYDANGNMIERVVDDGEAVYIQVYDMENRLERVSNANIQMGFIYDATGARLRTIETNTGDGSERTVYTPFPFFELEEQREVSPTSVTVQTETNSEWSHLLILAVLVLVLCGATVAIRRYSLTHQGVVLCLILTGMSLTLFTPTAITEAEAQLATTARKTYALGGTAVAQRVLELTGWDSSGDAAPLTNELFYLHVNHLGSITATTDEIGAVVDGSVVRYLPFGEYRENIAPTTNPDITDLGFTGHKHNDSIGLIYMNARYYVPEIGRFASADQIIPNLTNPQQLNRYTYALNNPITFVDADGHSALLIWLTKVTVEVAVDVLIQMSISYIFDPSVTSAGQAFDAVNWGDVAASGLMSLFGANRFVRAGIEAMGGVIYNLAHDPNYTSEQAVRDFIWGFFLNLGVDGIGEIIAKHGIDALVAGLRNLGFSDDAIRKMTRGASDEVDDAVPDGDGYHAPCPINSFSAETLVMTEDGPVPISDIRVGDMVLAYNEETGEVGYYPVTDLISHIDPVIVLLTIDGEVIETTPEHPFYEIATWMAWEQVGVIQPGLWTDAEDLQIGDKVTSANGLLGMVEAIEFVEQTQRMYNFTVETAHTYFVGDDGWLVHNCNNDYVYKSTEKHQQGGTGKNGVKRTKMDLSDATAQRVLNNGYENGKQVYGFHNGKIYVFQPDNVGSYHGYGASAGTRVPTAVLRQMKNDGVITNAQYNKFRKEFAH